MLSRINYSLTQLEYVVAVQQHGHFAKAAEACQVTQPTLSMQIQKLENDLGVVIFDRSKKPILLTEVGVKIFEQIQNVLYEAKKIEGIIQASLGGKLQGKLILGVIPTIAPYLLPRLLPYLQKKQTGLELRIRELQTHRIIEALGNDEIDVGVLATPLKIPKIHEQPLYYETFSLLCQKGHPLARTKKINPSALRGEDLWLLEEGHCLRHQILDVCSWKKSKVTASQYEFESGSLETLKRLISSFGGYTLLPALAADTIGSGTTLIPFERPIPAREIGLVFRREHYKKSLIDAMEKAILDVIPEEIRKIRPKDLEVLGV